MSFTVLDLFCGGGGASDGYRRAGFQVTGVDIRSQPGYPHTFIRGDALEYLETYGHLYDVIHASPPCQGYSRHVKTFSSPSSLTAGKDEPRLIERVRGVLADLGKPHVIENVVGARDDISGSVMLCGSMFGLPIRRHRLFEVSSLIFELDHSDCRGTAKEFAAARGWDWRDMSVTGKGRNAGTTEKWLEIMGVDRPMLQRQLAEAIPPAYTEYIGGEYLRHLSKPGKLTVHTH